MWINYKILIKKAKINAKTPKNNYNKGCDIIGQKTNTKNEK